MALEDYKRKRRFGQTPEPPPAAEAEDKHRFVVQKHHATRLHYDFRLEMEGVLKSWAVPKGPSLDPADKRLAMMVEDHPVSYVHFEGVIPPGNYGAGTVMVWDTGTWKPEGDASAMLKKGDLKFRLEGTKLRGSFVLAHIKSRRPGSKGNEWLLIKHRDEHVISGYDIEKFDESALTGRSLEEIARDKDSAQWKSRPAAATKKNEWLAESVSAAEGRARGRTKSFTSRLERLEGAVRAPMPKAIRPMLATFTEKPFHDADWLYEIKWDGYRALAFVDNGSVRLMSRNQNDMTADYPELAELSACVRAQQAIVDGEIVSLDEEGQPSFSLMQQRAGMGHAGHRVARRDTAVPIVYYVFDLLYLDGFDLRGVELEERKELLAEVLASTGLVRYSEHFPDGLKLYAAAKQRGLEGIVAKHRRSRYLEKRSRQWLKVKITERQECVIGGYTEPKGGREHFGSIVLGLYDKKGRLVHVGQAGSGFTQATHKDMWRRLQELKSDKNPFHGKVESFRETHWVRPVLVAEIKFTEWTHEGKSDGMKLRAPVYEGLRWDKPARECTLPAGIADRKSQLTNPK